MRQRNWHCNEASSYLLEGTGRWLKTGAENVNLFLLGNISLRQSRECRTLTFVSAFIRCASCSPISYFGSLIPPRVHCRLYIRPSSTAIGTQAARVSEIAFIAVFLEVGRR